MTHNITIKWNYNNKLMCCSMLIKQLSNTCVTTVFSFHKDFCSHWILWWGSRNSLVFPSFLSKYHIIPLEGHQFAATSCVSQKTRKGCMGDVWEGEKVCGRALVLEALSTWAVVTFGTWAHFHWSHPLPISCWAVLWGEDNPALLHEPVPVQAQPQLRALPRTASPSLHFLRSTFITSVSYVFKLTRKPPFLNTKFINFFSSEVCLVTNLQQQYFQWNNFNYV